MRARNGTQKPEQSRLPPLWLSPVSNEFVCANGLLSCSAAVGVDAAVKFRLTAISGDCCCRKLPGPSVRRAFSGTELGETDIGSGVVRGCSSLLHLQESYL